MLMLNFSILYGCLMRFISPSVALKENETTVCDETLALLICDLTLQVSAQLLPLQKLFSSTRVTPGDDQTEVQR